MKASWFSFHGEKLCTLIEGSPITQNGFLAKRSRPCHPLYRQQQPADQIRMMYSSPNTTIITNSYKDKERHFQVCVCGCVLVSSGVLKIINQLTNYITYITGITQWEKYCTLCTTALFNKETQMEVSLPD